MKKVEIVYFDAASGHRSAAVALERALRDEHPDWRIRAINVIDIFAGHRSFQRIVRAGIGYFNYLLKREWIYDLKGLVNLSLLFHDLLTPRGLRRISRFWESDPPDLVVSVTPMYNPALYRSARVVNPRVECVTIPVDFEEFKPRYWFTPRVPQHYLVATERLAQQARAAGADERLIHRIGGMIVDPACYAASRIDPSDELSRLGLDPSLPVGLVSFGGQGSVTLGAIARSLAQPELRLNLIFLCGKQTRVREDLLRLETPYRKAVIGYSSETPIHYQRLADFVIGKPGSMTITEALIARQPLVAIRSRSLREVQRGNEAWITRHGVGLVVERLEDLAPAVREVLGSTAYRRRTQREFHRGVFEAAALIGSLLEGTEGERRRAGNAASEMVSARG